MTDRILILSTEFPPGPGGIGTHAYQLALQLTHLNWEVSVVTPQDYADETAVLDFNAHQPFRIFRQHHQPVSILEGFSRLAHLRRTVRVVRPDLILSSGTQAVWLASVHHLTSGLPYAAVAHGGAEFGSRRAMRRHITRWAYSRPDLVIAVSHYSKNQMLDLGARPGEAHVIPNGADETSFYPLPGDKPNLLVERLGLQGKTCLLTVGSVTRRKGQEVVIRAMPAILAERPDVHYLIAGMPVEQRAFEALAAEVGVENHVHFLGVVDHQTLLEAYNACALFVMTSRHSSDGDSEGYGIAVIEAALCGRPAVVSGESGLAEAVEDGITGLHVPEDDPGETARTILQLLTDDLLRKELSANAMRRARTEGTWARRVSEYAAALTGLSMRNGRRK